MSLSPKIQSSDEQMMLSHKRMVEERMHMLEVVVAAVEVVVGYMLELELDISSCNDVSKLEVVVELVDLVLLGALEVLLVLAHLGHQVVPWVLEYRVVLEL